MYLQYITCIHHRWLQKINQPTSTTNHPTKQQNQIKSDHPNHPSKKSPTGPTELTPKPEYLIAWSQLRGRLVRSFHWDTPGCSRTHPTRVTWKDTTGTRVVTGLVPMWGLVGWFWFPEVTERLRTSILPERVAAMNVAFFYIRFFCSITPDKGLKSVYSWPCHFLWSLLKNTREFFPAKKTVLGC